MSTSARMNRVPRLALSCAAVLVAVAAPRAQSLPATVAAKTKLVDPDGPYAPGVKVDWEFAKGVAWLGDLDGDGWGEVATLDGGNNGGGDNQLRLLHLGADGSIASFEAYTSGTGGFSYELVPGYGFGPVLAPLGDLDGDGYVDLVVAGPGGSPVILSSDGNGGFLAPVALLGLTGNVIVSVGAPGDLDGDGVVDLLVGTPGDDDAGTDRGSVRVVFLNADGTIKSVAKITQSQGGFTGALSDGDAFGSSVTAIGDLDGNGTADLAVGAIGTDAGGNNRGAVWVLLMGPGATVLDQVRITAGEGGFTGALSNGDFLGASVALLPDLDGDGAPELAAGAPGVDVGLNKDFGAVWLLSLGADGRVTGQARIGPQTPGLGGSLDPGDRFGTAVAAFSSPDGGPCGGVLVGSPGGFEWAQNAGNLWVLFLDAGSWTDLGGGLPGLFGVPDLAPTGVPCQGTPISLTFSSGQTMATASLWFIGFSAVDLPFKGGTLVPDPHLILVLPTDSSGNLTLSATWPPGVPSGFATIVQCWVHDAGAPAGLSATHALMGTAP